MDMLIGGRWQPRRGRYLSLDSAHGRANRHGNVAGLGQALDQLSDDAPFIQGRNEQALVHAAMAFAKHSQRRATLAVTAPIGPGALNMVTGAALATVNRLPALLPPALPAAIRAVSTELGRARTARPADENRKPR